MATDYGQDFTLVTDLETTLGVTTGPRIVAEAIARRLQTPNGRLIGDPNYGYDVTQFVNQDMSPADIDDIERSVALEAEKDERVASAEASAVLDAEGVLEITLNATLITDETFTLVLAVSDVTVEILSVE